MINCIYIYVTLAPLVSGHQNFVRRISFGGTWTIRQFETFRVWIAKLWKMCGTIEHEYVSMKHRKIHVCTIWTHTFTLFTCLGRNYCNLQIRNRIMNKSWRPAQLKPHNNSRAFKFYRWFHRQYDLPDRSTWCYQLRLIVSKFQSIFLSFMSIDCSRPINSSLRSYCSFVCPLLYLGVYCALACRHLNACVSLFLSRCRYRVPYIITGNK